MKKYNKWYVHVGAVVLMLAVSLIFFSPVLEGKKMSQGDTQKFESMVKENKDYHEKTGEYANWNSSMFGGMPAYQIGATAPSKSVLTPVKNVGTLHFLGLDSTAGILFFYLIGFYIALLALGVSPLMALLGALAFGLGSYNVIIIEAGHLTKACAMALTAPILAGMMLCLRRPAEGKKKSDWLWGGILFTVSLGLQLLCNHIQITFYTMIGGVALGVAYLVDAIVKKNMPKFLPGAGILLLGCVLAFACNARTLMVSMEYAQKTMRGGSEITVTPENLYHEAPQASESAKTGGLDIDYAFSWSYGIGETYTLLVPGALGGGSGEQVGRESASYKAFRQEQVPLYWGDQPFTSGPVYFGAIIIFLALVGLIVVKGPDRWWLLAATLIAILMSWGRNFMPFNEWIFNHIPLYNKFRTPSMSLVLANVTMILLGILGLKRIFSGEMTKKQVNVALYVAGGVTAGVILLGLILSGGFSFSGAADRQMAAQYGAQWNDIQNIFIQDRKALFSADSWRSLVFVVLAFAALWLYVNKMGKLKSAAAVVAAVLAVLTVIDLWGVDRRYVNEDDYVNPRQLELRRDKWDYDIDELAAQFGDRNYRVLNLAVNTYNDSKPSAFHHQVGGYSAVKMRRYQDLIDFYLSSHINPNVLNMLNTRYVVLNNGSVQRNPDALGASWFVKEVKRVNSPDEEILALNEINPATTAVVDVSQAAIGAKEISDYVFDSTATIKVEHQQPYNPDYLKYTTHAATAQLAVFSEIYYAPDWRVYIDGKPAEYFSANYVLRAMIVPAGDHVIEFKNEAPLFHRLDTVTVIASVLFVLVIAGSVFLYYRKKKQTDKTC